MIAEINGTEVKVTLDWNKTSDVLPMDIEKNTRLTLSICQEIDGEFYGKIDDSCYFDVEEQKFFKVFFGYDHEEIKSFIDSSIVVAWALTPYIEAVKPVF